MPRILFSIVCFCLFLCFSKSILAESQKPNIVIIFADDLGYGDLECYGHPKHKTPNLNQMAKEGARLTRFHVPVPYCGPSRASLLTGRYPWRHGLWNNPCPNESFRKPSIVDKIGISQNQLLMSEVLQKEGYATTCIGKWHLGHQPNFLPTRNGFDSYYGIPYSNDMRPVHILENETVAEYPVIQANLTKKYTDRAVHFITENKDNPFFLYLPHPMPHKPLAASERFYNKSGAGLYGDVIAELDWGVGEVLKTLKELNLDEKTLVVFTSDNGPWFGGHTAGLSGMKATNWDGGLRVPFIARWPGKIPANQTIDELGCVIDLFPTITKLAGVELPNNHTVEGKNLFPVLTQNAKSSHQYLFSMKGDNVTTIRDERWKLIVYKSPRQILEGKGDNWIDPRGPDGVTIIAQHEQYMPSSPPGLTTGDKAKNGMLFDLSKDPGEQSNVANQHPSVVKRMKAAFDKMTSQAKMEMKKHPLPVMNK